MTRESGKPSAFAEGHLGLIHFNADAGNAPNVDSDSPTAERVGGEYFRRLRISRRASETIDRWTDALVAGRLSLAALPLALFRLYQAGVADGRAQREPELAQARHEADRLWLLCFGEEERREYLLARLDEAARIAADEGGIEGHLERAFALYCRSLDNVRGEVARG